MFAVRHPQTVIAGRGVNENQVKVGRGHHFTAAQLAQRQHHHACALNMAVAADEFLLDGGVQAGQRGFGDIGKRLSRVSRLQHAAQALHADLETAVVVPTPGDTELLFEIVGSRQQFLQLNQKSVPRRRRVEKIGVQHAVENGRPVAQMLGQAGRLAHDFGDQIEELRIGVKQGKQLHARRQAGEKLVEAEEGDVRRRGLADRL
jgi:hypothetical protein